MFYDINGNKILGDGLNPNYADSECVTAFMNYMAKKTAEVKMTNSLFVNPHGLTWDSHTTPADLLKLAVVMCAYNVGLNIWSVSPQTYYITNKSRTPQVRELPKGAFANGFNNSGKLNPRYICLGGKGGSLINGSKYLRTQSMLFEIDGKTIALAIMTRDADSYVNYHNPDDGDGMYYCINEILWLVDQKLQGQTPVRDDTTCPNLTRVVDNSDASQRGGYAAIVLPTSIDGWMNTIEPSTTVTDSQTNITSISPKALLSLPYSVYESQDLQIAPASTTKIMTTICALDWATNLNQMITVKLPADDPPSGSSGSTFYSGDTLTLLDALKIMMVESNNLLANTIARVVGRMILSDKEID